MDLGALLGSDLLLWLQAVGEVGIFGVNLQGQQEIIYRVDDGLENDTGLCQGISGWEPVLRIEYLVAENRILRDQIKGRLQLSDAER